MSSYRAVAAHFAHRCLHKCFPLFPCKFDSAFLTFTIMMARLKPGTRFIFNARLYRAVLISIREITSEFVKAPLFRALIFIGNFLARKYKLVRNFPERTPTWRQIAKLLMLTHRSRGDRLYRAIFYSKFNKDRTNSAATVIPVRNSASY